jgi:hypothetical protein
MIVKMKKKTLTSVLNLLRFKDRCVFRAGFEIDVHVEDSKQNYCIEVCKPDMNFYILCFDHVLFVLYS